MPPTVVAPRSQTEPEQGDADDSLEEDGEDAQPAGTTEADAARAPAEAEASHADAGAEDAKEAGKGCILLLRPWQRRGQCGRSTDVLQLTILHGFWQAEVGWPRLLATAKMRTAIQATTVMTRTRLGHE